MGNLRRVVSTLFSLKEPLSRRQYIVLGVALMVIKYTVDLFAIGAATGLLWTPLDYLMSLISTRGPKVAALPSELTIFLLLWTLPFVWLGVILSVRRAQDAGVPPWLVVLFFVPLLNYALMLALALAPTAPGVEPAVVERLDPDYSRRSRQSTTAGALAGALTALVLIVIGVRAMGTYGVTVFMGTPFAVGLVAAFVANRITPRGPGETAGIVLASMALVGAMLLLVALEGAICIAMAVPLAVPIALLGGIVGRGIARTRRTSGASMAMIVALLPAAGSMDRALDLPVAREVVTAVDVDAPPERVWQQVVAFDEIREPPAWYFRLGLAYPLRARIHGSGVGAMRTCEFTTGAFREPITVWEEPFRLAFDVAEQPAPLQEWSPYSRVYAPHLSGYFRTTRGEFRLTALNGGRTKLEGRTWYSLRMYPTLYWTPLTEAILHRIHGRVLTHVKAQAEAAY